MFRKLILGFGILSCLAAFPSCDKDDDDDDPQDALTHFSDTMSGAKEAPASPSTATGNVTGEYNHTTKILTITVTYTGLSSNITMWHIHKGAVGVSGPPLPGFPWGTMGASPFTWSSPALDATQEADLLNNLYYVNIHTANHGGGEIRGQLLKH
jgi:hypothetical protein